MLLLQNCNLSCYVMPNIVIKELIHVIHVLQVLSAYVKSIEDHGFILHFGLPTFAGFMSKPNQTGNHSCTLPSLSLLPWLLA